jgi:hypothetical protein
MNILIIGCCGVGKTWVMKQLLTKEDKLFKLGKINFHENKIIIIGKYDWSIFEGSDRLSMSAITDVEKVIKYAKGKIIIWEGDRFMNKTFLQKAKPIVLKIKGDGSLGRKKRGSNQTESHLKRIGTKVEKMPENHSFENSTDCLKWIVKNTQNEKN